MTGWRTARLGDVCEKITDGTHHSPANGPVGDFMYVTAKNIKPWGLDLKHISYIDAKTHQEIYARCDVRKDDILYVKDGATTGRVALNTLDEQFSLLSSVGVLRPGPEVKPKFLLYALQVPSVLDRMLGDMAGVAITRLTIRKLKEAEIPLAPIEQQDEIVAELEKQFSRLDEAVANLQRVKANLKRYKASVLKDAVEGRLVPTEAELARRKGRIFETGEQLLNRLLDSRRKSWTGRGKYIEPNLSRPPDLQVLPDGWTWIPFGLLGKDPFNTVQTGPFGAQLHNTDFKTSGVPVIAVGNLTGTGFRRDGLYFIDQDKAAQLARYDVWAGDILFARSGATLGKVCVAPSDVTDWRMTGHILRARLNTQFLRPEVALYSLAALPAVTKQIFGNVRGVTRPGFNTSLLESIWVPVPPLAEQDRIISEVDRRLSLVSGVESEVDTNLKRAQALRQSTLAKAFSVGAQTC